MLNESNTRRKNLTLESIDHEKAYDIVPQRWIINCLKMYKISVEVKFYRENYENRESGIDSRWEKLSRSEDPERSIPGRCTMTITFCNSDDATQPDTKLVNCKKSQSTNVNGRHQTVCQNWKGIGYSNAGSENIKQDIEKCAMLIMKSSKRHTTDGMELLNQEKIRMLGGKETYKILGNIKCWHHQKSGDERKNKIKRISQDNKKAGRNQTILQGPYKRDKYLSSHSRKMLRNILKVDQRRT